MKERNEFKPVMETILSPEGAELYEGTELVADQSPDGPVETHVVSQEAVLGQQVVRRVSKSPRCIRRLWSTGFPVS